MRPVPASLCFHRALISLMPAMGLSFLVYRLRFNLAGWLAAAAAIVAWGSGVYWLWRGSLQLRVEQNMRARR
jgi:hypothetical protein